MLFLDRSTPEPVRHMLASGELSKGCWLARFRGHREYIKELIEHTNGDFGGLEIIRDHITHEIQQTESALANKSQSDIIKP